MPVSELSPYTIRKLAKELGMNPRRLSREFRWWCRAKGLEPKDFYEIGIGYRLPWDFVRYARVLRAREKARVVFISSFVVPGRRTFGGPEH